MINNKVRIESFNGREIFVERREDNKDIIYVKGILFSMIIELSTASSVELSVAIGIDDVDFEQNNLAARLASLAGITTENINNFDDSPYKNLLGYIPPVKDDDVPATADANDVPAPTADDVEVPTLTAEVPAEYTNDFDNVVERLSHLSGFQFVMMVNYAKSHHNSFPKFSGFVGVVNADDAYCSCIINMTRKYGESLEKKAFAVLTGNDKSNEEKAEFFEALKIINK